MKNDFVKQIIENIDSVKDNCAKALSAITVSSKLDIGCIKVYEGKRAVCQHFRRGTGCNNCFQHTNKNNFIKYAEELNSACEKLDTVVQFANAQCKGCVAKMEKDLCDSVRQDIQELTDIALAKNKEVKDILVKGCQYFKGR